MTLRLVFLTTAIAVIAWGPASAQARTDCAYASGPVYVENGLTAHDAGTSGKADLAAGGCLDNAPPNVGFDGGLLEVGVGLDDGQIAGTRRFPGVYAVADGDDQNTVTHTSGYGGLSNFETAAWDQCESFTPPSTNDGAGTNSGGCVTLINLASVPVPLLACGNASGPSWDQAGRDGCGVP